MESTTTIISNKAYFTNEVEGKKLTAIITEYSNGWKQIRIHLPNGYELSSGGDTVRYKKNYNLVIEYMKAGQLNKQSVWATPVRNYIYEAQNMVTC